MNKKIFLTVLLSLLLSVSLVLGQDKITIGLGGGISKATSSGSEYWNMGFTAGGELFQETAKDISIGFRVAYNRWSPNEDKLKSEIVGNSGLNLAVSGSTSIIELIPSIRIFSSYYNNDQQSGFFVQAGAGLYIIKLDADVTASYNGNYAVASIDESDSRFGISMGAGIVLDCATEFKIMINPMYNIIFNEQESINYFTLNLGLIFKSHTQL